MRVCVVGAGVLGLTSAWYLQQAGCQVTLIEREATVAQGASHGNGGLLSSGLCAPWAAPGALKTVLRSFFQPQGPLRIKLDGSGFQLHWMLMALRNSHANAFARNRAAMTALAQYSLTQWHRLSQTLDLQFDQRHDGLLLTVQTPVQLENAKRIHAALQAQDQSADLLSASELYQVEPGLQRSALRFLGALRLPGESSGDSAAFCRQLCAQLQAQGVEILFNTPVTSFEQDGNRIKGLQTAQGNISADAYVIATGAWSSPLLKKLIRLPVYPVKGYSLTAAVTQPEHSLRSALIDEQDKVSIARFGQRLRITAFAEFDGFNTHLDAKRLAQLRSLYEARFPGSANLAEPRP